MRKHEIRQHFMWCRFPTVDKKVMITVERMANLIGCHLAARELDNKWAPNPRDEVREDGAVEPRGWFSLDGKKVDGDVTCIELGFVWPTKSCGVVMM